MSDTHRAVTELIQVGRDREAVHLGASIHEPANGGAMDPLTQLAQLGPLRAGIAGGITPDQLDRPTPCAEVTVRGVLEHMIGGATAFAPADRGEISTKADTTDVLATFGPALDGLVHAWDFATATGQAHNPPNELVTEGDAFVHQTLDPLGDGRTLGPAVEPPPDASPIEWFAAYTGRRPLAPESSR